MYKEKLKEKLMTDTMEQLKQCKEIVELLKIISDEEFGDFEEHFLLQYFDTYKDVKTSCEVLVHQALMDRKFVDLILLKWIRKLREKNEKEWYDTNKKEWFEWLKENLGLDF
jgi:hypothetical protein